MRHLAAISLLLLLWAPLVSTQASLHYQQYKHRRTVKWQILHKINRQELILLRFSRQDKAIAWTDEREFRYRGSYFDVVQRRQTTDSLYLWCWQDHAEAALNRKIEQAIARAAGQTPQEHQTREHLLHFLKSLYCSQRPLPKIGIALVQARAKFPKPTFFYPSRGQRPPPPPPWHSGMCMH